MDGALKRLWGFPPDLFLIVSKEINMQVSKLLAGLVASLTAVAVFAQPAPAPMKADAAPAPAVEKKADAPKEQASGKKAHKHGKHAAKKAAEKAPVDAAAK
jgi:hypothetical protein